jgi:hypothetical protein
VAYEHYTKCEQASGHSSMNQYVQALLYTGPYAAITALITLTSPHPFCAFIALEGSAALWGLAYCDWWLYHRLVCLGGDQTAVGMVISTEPGSGKEFPDTFDTDFSFNLLLASNVPGAIQSTVESSSPYGFLIKEQDATKNEGLPWDAYKTTDAGTGVESAALHCELEGAGVYDVMIACQVALGLSVAALIACLADALVGTIVAVILAILALLAALIGGLIAANDTGSPEDVGLSSIETNNTGGVGADIMGVLGTWVYDSGHNNQDRGWNEIHPVKKAEKLGTWTGNWPADTPTLIAAWTEKVAEAESPLTVAEQEKPNNQWDIHPLIDGCASDDSEEDEPPHPPH